MTQEFTKMVSTVKFLIANFTAEELVLYRPRSSTAGAHFSFFSTEAGLFFVLLAGVARAVVAVAGAKMLPAGEGFAAHFFAGSRRIFGGSALQPVSHFPARARALGTFVRARRACPWVALNRTRMRATMRAYTRALVTTAMRKKCVERWKLIPTTKTPIFKGWTVRAILTGWTAKLNVFLLL